MLGDHGEVTDAASPSMVRPSSPGHQGDVKPRRLSVDDAVAGDSSAPSPAGDADAHLRFAGVSLLLVVLVCFAVVLLRQSSAVPVDCSDCGNGIDANATNVNTANVEQKLVAHAESGGLQQALRLSAVVANAACAANYLILALLFFVVYCRRSAQAHSYERAKKCAVRTPVNTASAHSGGEWSTPNPPISFICPVKGTHAGTVDNWRALMNHGWEGRVDIVFVVQEEVDTAYMALQQMLASGALKPSGAEDRVVTLVAGLANRNSQKLHNMIYAIERLPKDEGRLVLMLDDDMVLGDRAVPVLVGELLKDSKCLAASGFSCDVPAQPTALDHAGCMFRLMIDFAGSSGRANAAWGGCCMMRRSDLLDHIPGGVMEHWKNNAYSDDWVITQVANRLGRRVANPPLLFLNLVHFSSLQKLYNFLHRQIFVLDTYVEDTRCCCCQFNRLGSYLLAHLMGLMCLVFTAAPLLLAAQTGLLASQMLSDDSQPVEEVASPEVLSLLACWLVAMPLCFLSGCAAVSGQSRLVDTISEVAGAHRRAKGRWNALVAPFGFQTFCALGVGFTMEGLYSNRVVWSNVRYTKKKGCVQRVHRLDQICVNRHAGKGEGVMKPAAGRTDVPCEPNRITMRDPLMVEKVAHAFSVVKELSFPPGFDFGAVTAAGHVEGGHVDTNWERWEKRGTRKDGRATVNGGQTAGRMCDSWEQFLDVDLPLIVKTGLTSHRFSIEWSRLMPTADTFDQNALARYVEWCVALREAKVEPCVTLLHFTYPGWFEDLGGWAVRENVVYFERFVNFVLPKLAPHCSRWCTINEPVGTCINGYLIGIHPPGKQGDIVGMVRAMANQHLGHRHASLVISALNPKAIIMVATNVAYYDAANPCNPVTMMISAILDRLWNKIWVDALVFGRFPLPLDLLAWACGFRRELRSLKGTVTHLGINAYSRVSVQCHLWRWLTCRRFLGHNGELPAGVVAGHVAPAHNADVQRAATGPLYFAPHRHGYEMSDFEWDLLPSLFEHVLASYWQRYKMPMYVTESGCADACVPDTRGVRYLSGCLRAMHNAVESGIDVRGYYYFALLDNFEWAEGYGPQFGLYKIDRDSANLQRISTLRQQLLCHFLQGRSTVPVTKADDCPITTADDAPITKADNALIAQRPTPWFAPLGASRAGDLRVSDADSVPLLDSSTASRAPPSAQRCTGARPLHRCSQG